MRRAAFAILLLLAPSALAAATMDEDAGWAQPSQTSLRPGVRVYTSGAQCTTNFVFTSADNSSVYIGLAAHCVNGLPLGAAATFNVPGTGKLAYSSWRTMDAIGEDEPQALAYNDFALIRIDDASRHRVSPAMRHFGGPTGMVGSSDLAPGDKVLTYGNSGLRQGIEPSNWHEGYILNEYQRWHRDVWTATPGIFGDSGSGMITADGQAMGVVVTISPFGGSNGVTLIEDAVRYANHYGGMDVQLATWELLDAGVLPAPLG